MKILQTLMWVSVGVAGLGLLGCEVFVRGRSLIGLPVGRKLP